jgi:hypothetical protein
LRDRIEAQGPTVSGWSIEALDQREESIVTGDERGDVLMKCLGNPVWVPSRHEFQEPKQS